MSLTRRLQRVESRVRTSEAPEIEVWHQSERSSEADTYTNNKTGETLTVAELDERAAARRERYGGQVHMIVVDYVDAPPRQREGDTA